MSEQHQRAADDNRTGHAREGRLGTAVAVDGRPGEASCDRVACGRKTALSANAAACDAEPRQKAAVEAAVGGRRAHR